MDRRWIDQFSNLFKDGEYEIVNGLITLIIFFIR